MILLIDNYDSFVYNLDRYLQRLGQSTLVVRSDAIGVEAISRLQVAAIVISPGPKSPDDAGCSLEVVRRLSGHIPILGVCLGHQVIGQAFGGNIRRASQPIHGQSSTIRCAESQLFLGLPERFDVGRYHSLVIDPVTLPKCLKATAWTDDGTIMALEHVQHLVFGVQFHPESILTSYGYEILANFLKACELECGSVPESDFATVTGP